MTDKRKSPCTAGTVTGASENTQEQYSTDFTEKQAEEIWKRDFRRICIGAAVVLALILLGVI